jgi:hypothetical protein
MIWFGRAQRLQTGRQVGRLADDCGLRCRAFADLVADAYAVAQSNHFWYIWV